MYILGAKMYILGAIMYILLGANMYRCYSVHFSC